MIALHAARTQEALQKLSARYDLVLVPGFKDSGPHHWQTLWQQQGPFFQRITQKRWDVPDIELWVSAIHRLLTLRGRPAVLIGHSLGALASSCIAVDRNPLLAGVMLVAPAEPVRFEAEDLVPQHTLGLPSLVVASHDDPTMRFHRAEFWSGVWGAKLVDLGEAGHINAEAGFGPWPHGLDLLVEFVQTL